MMWRHFTVEPRPMMLPQSLGERMWNHCTVQSPGSLPIGTAGRR
ncbi:hypothetical protein [Streptomyces puniciscabiei]